MPSRSSDSDRARLREIYRSIRKRTTNPRCKDYAHYGGRGIKMCDEWSDPVDGFDRFMEWSLSHGYRSDLTLDRVSNSKPYAPWNCRWVSRKGQAYNRTTNHYIRTSDGEVHTMEEWSIKMNIPQSTMDKRIRLGWSPDEVVGKKKHV